MTAFADAYEAYCQLAHAHLVHARSARERAEFLASCCPGCMGGGGQVCDDCWAAGYGLPDESHAPTVWAAA